MALIKVACVSRFGGDVSFSTGFMDFAVIRSPFFKGGSAWSPAFLYRIDQPGSVTTFPLALKTPPASFSASAASASAWRILMVVFSSSSFGRNCAKSLIYIILQIICSSSVILERSGRFNVGRSASWDSLETSVSLTTALSFRIFANAPLSIPAAIFPRSSKTAMFSMIAGNSFAFSEET